MDELDRISQQDADELSDEVALHQEQERAEVKCALALLRALAKDFGQYRAVRIDGPLNWTITNPRTEEAMLAALETTEPPAALEAAQPIIDRLNRWETFWTNRYRWSPPDNKRIEVRVGDLRRLRAASADRSPEGGDPEEGRHAKHESAVAKPDAQPTPVSDPISNKGER